MRILPSWPGAPALTAVLLVAALAGCADGVGPTTSTSSGVRTPADAAGGAGSSTGAQPTGDDDTGRSVPELLDFVAQDTQGQQVRGADLAGQDVVLWFWAPWCTVCARAADEVSSVAGARDDVRFVGVGGLSSDASALDRFVTQNEVGDLVHLADVDGALYTRFGISQQHSFVVLHADGQVETVAAYGSDLGLEELVADEFG